MTRAKAKPEKEAEPNQQDKPNKPKVIMIPPTKPYEGEVSYPAVYGKYRTVAYCRSSNEEEERKQSYEIQSKYYEEFIKKKPRWEFVGVYGDSGRGRISPSGNTGLAKMIADAKKGKFDLIITNPQTYFGRSSYETIRLLEKLRGYGVGINYEVGGKILTSKRLAEMFIASNTANKNSKGDLADP